MKRLYFCRHGESEGNATWIYASRTPAPLTELGRKQADASGKQAQHAKLHIDVMLVSPLKRAQETADILAPFLGNPQREDYADIMERDFSPLDGTSYEDRDFKKYIALDTIPGVETTAELQKRAEKVLTYLAQRPEENILLVSHGAFGRALVRAIKGIPWQQEYANGFNTPLPHAEILQLV